jgi:hypothetical protein
MILFLFVIGCTTVHPITEVPYISLEFGVDGVRLDDFPRSLIDSLQWNDLASAELSSVSEELHIAIKSDFPPYYLFRMSNEKNSYGDIILYWPKPDQYMSLTPNKNMHDHLKGICKEFNNAGIFEYCVPETSKLTDWNKTFKYLEHLNIWTLGDNYEFDAYDIENNLQWSLIYQVRAGMNYRTFRHDNPDYYVPTDKALNVMKIVDQLNRVVSDVKKPDNYDLYEGITSGTVGATFKPCNNDEVWRFNGNIASITSSNALPIKVTHADSLRFLVKLEGTVQDEWVAYRNNSGFTKTISPININSIVVTSATECD